MKKIQLLAVMLLLLQLPVCAMNLRYGDTITISEPINEDLYISGGTVHVNANIYGDLVIAGGTVVIREKVYGDVLVIAGNCTISDYISEDVRCIGGTLLINGDIGEDLVTGGGDIRIAPGGLVKGDVLMGGGSLAIEGDVQGSVRAYGGTLNFGGTVEKNLLFHGDAANMDGAVNGSSEIAARKLYLGGHSVFGKDVRYWTEGNPRFTAKVLSGHAVFDPTLSIPSGKWQYAGFATLLAMLGYMIVVLIFITIAIWLFHRTFYSAAGYADNQPGKALGSGFLFLVLTPLIIVGLMISLVGIPLALMLLIGYISLLLLAHVIAAVLATYWLALRYRKQWSKVQYIFIALGLFIPIKLISLMPVAGWLFALVAAMLSFGAIWRVVKNYRHRQTT